MNYEKRIRKLSAALSRRHKQEGEVNCAIFTSIPNLKYLFNYAGVSYERFSCGLASIESGKTALVIPKLDEPKVKSSSTDSYFPWTDSEGYEGALEKAFTSIGIKGSARLGCEDEISLRLMESVRKVKPSAKFRSITSEISSLRLIKDDEELDAIRGSTKKLSRAYEKLPELLKSGRTENEVGFEMKRVILDEGAASVDFCAIQSGANSAIPHSETTAKKISMGDMIVADISCIDDSGYFADFTRTFVVGNASSEQLKVFDLVKEAQKAGTTKAGPAVAAQDVDRAARQVIEKAGYGEYFVHRTGHGLGLEVHEGPWIKSGNKDKLKPGMVHTVEPGIYLGGKFGVRIEDNVIINSSGNENLTAVTRDLIQV